VLGGAFGGTFQQRLLLPIRAPTTVSGLAILHELQARAAGNARIVVFDGQLGVAVGSWLDGKAGPRAETMYWALLALADEVQAHGRVFAWSAALEKELLDRAAACLKTLG
jgi:hypothetical protein